MRMSIHTLVYNIAVSSNLLNQFQHGQSKDQPKRLILNICISNLAPEVGFEPTTNWLTANCATAALLRNNESILTNRQNLVNDKRTKKIKTPTEKLRGAIIHIALNRVSDRSNETDSSRPISKLSRKLILTIIVDMCPPRAFFVFIFRERDRLLCCPVHINKNILAQVFSSGKCFFKKCAIIFADRVVSRKLRWPTSGKFMI